MTSHKGPSRIFDETIEEAGGIVHCEIAADMPRDVKQISNARQALKEKEEQNEFAALLGHAKQDAGIRNMQWTPNPRVVRDRGVPPPPNNFGNKFFSIEKLLFYCFHRYAIINEDFRQ